MQWYHTISHIQLYNTNSHIQVFTNWYHIWTFNCLKINIHATVPLFDMTCCQYTYLPTSHMIYVYTCFMGFLVQQNVLVTMPLSHEH